MRMLRWFTLASAFAIAGGYFASDAALCQQPNAPGGVSESEEQPDSAQRPRSGRGDGERSAAEQADGQRPRDRGPGRGRGPGGLPPIPIFRALDQDRDGELSQEEIERAATALRTLDENNDGRLDRSELMPDFPPGGPRGRGPRAGEGSPADRPGANFSQRLRQLDANSDGKITADEVPDRLKQVVARADSDGDGAVTMDELREMRQRGAGPDDRPGGPPRGDRPQRDQRPDQDDQPQ